MSQEPNTPTTPTKPSDQIAVTLFRHTVLWPLLLRGHYAIDPDGGAKIKQKRGFGLWLDALRAAGWQDADGKDISSDFSYDEIVYFHPFVRDFLYGDGATPLDDRPLRRMKRTDVRRIEMVLGGSPGDPLAGVAVDLHVESLELYLTKPNVMVLVAQFSSQGTGSKTFAPLPLNQVLHVQEQLRRVAPPFWWDFGDKGSDAALPGQCLRSARWVTEPPDRFKLSASGMTLDASQRQFDTFTHRGAEPPLFAHWQQLFGPAIQPLRSRHDLEKPGDRLFLQQALDERAPTMSLIGVDNPSAISEGDYDRIMGADGAGKNPYPYNEEFLRERRGGFNYNRFAPTTRYFVTGYHFACVGDMNDGFFANVLPGHFQRHYLRLALLAHCQHATLLHFADELSEELKLLPGKGPSEELADPRFRRTVAELQMRFLKWRSRSYFREVSNQLQAKELFDLFLKHLGTERLFEQVAATSEQLHAAMTQEEARLLSQEQKHLAEEQKRLADVATLGIPASIGLSVLGVCYALLAVPGAASFWTAWGSLWDWFGFSLLVTGVALVAWRGLISLRRRTK